MEKFLRLLFFYFLCSYFQVFAFPKRTTEIFIIRYLEDRQIIPVRVELNVEEKIEHVSTLGGETLYDFNEGKVAYKDINSSQCFISDIIEETLEGDRRKLKNLRNGIIRGSYMPTFTIEEEPTNQRHVFKKFGNILTGFCEGNTVSFVTRQKRRKKRDASGDRGQFTHHSYGHYGHQTNNYAHYGHETHITGTVDKDGQLQNHRVSQKQVRTGGLQVYPKPGFLPNGPQVHVRDSKMEATSPQTQYQTPTHQESFSANARNLGTGGSRQFSLQSTHEGGYQLNLPLGLQAGNKYQGVHNVGHHGIQRPQSQVPVKYHRYPETYRPPEQTRFGQPPYSIAPEYPGISESQLDPGRIGSPGGAGIITTHIHQGISEPISPTVTSDRRITQARVPGRPISDDTQVELRTTTVHDRRQPGLGYTSQDRMHGDKRIIPNDQLIPTRTGLSELTPTFLRPSISTPDLHTPIYQPGMLMPAAQMPGRTLQDSLSIPEQISFGMPRTTTTGQQGQYFRPSISTPSRHISTYQPGISMPSVQLPGQISTTLPGAETFDMQPITGIQRPNYELPSMDMNLRHRQQYMPSGLMHGQEHLQLQNIQHPIGDGIHRGIKTDSQAPILHPPSSIDTAVPRITHISPLTPASTIQSIRYPTPEGILPRPDNTERNGLQFPVSIYPQSTGQEYPRRDISSHISKIPSYIRITPTIQTGLENAQFLNRETGAIPPEDINGYQIPTALNQKEKVPASLHGLTSSGRIDSELPIAGSRRTATDQTRFVSSRLFGQNSASSQTQIQTGLEGNAAEASASGQYRGLGSQTQVQGGYVGNGSFSAQAQSGFTGGIVQSQVKGNEQVGLSGSSSQIEGVGLAQSQVQVSQPSGSASSSAQGRFTGGMTQVQAQSGKSSGTAGAQSQSTGLSTSNVQVNIGGKDANEQERFQGTISASVQGSHLTGQSQTQLQGGYHSGRTYVATAQGGFDSSSGFQPYASPVGSLSNQTAAGRQFSAVNGQEYLHAAGGRQLSGLSFSGYGTPTESGTTQNKQISQTPILGEGSTVYTDRSGITHDGIFQTGLPHHQLPLPVVTPQQPLRSANLPAVKSTAWHPSPEPQSTSASSTQSAHRYPYPSSQTDSIGVRTDERNLPPTHDQRYLRHSIRPHDLEYPQSPILTLPHPNDQQSNYTAEVPINYPVLTSKTSSLGSQTESGLSLHHIPTLQRPVLQPELQIRHQQPFVFPSQTTFSQPSLQMIPSPMQSQKMSFLTRPDGSHYIDFKPGTQQPSLISGQSQTEPEQSKVSPPKSHSSLTTPKVTEPTILTPPLTTDITPKLLGVSEPNKTNCCETLRALKRRCCDKTYRDRTSTCCKFNPDDIFDFSSEGELEESKEPCKVVKAICYIVYKPVGKARVCKPTATNAC